MRQEREVAELVTRLASAFNSRDAAALAALYTEEATLLPPGEALVQGKGAIREWFEKALQRLGRITLTPIESNESIDFGFQVGIFSVSWDLTAAQDRAVELRPQQFGKYLLVFKRTEWGWRIHSDMWNLDAEPQQEHG
jgi:uncharacterized protein (TIGR02246 family)